MELDDPRWMSLEAEPAGSVERSRKLLRDLSARGYATADEAVELCELLCHQFSTNEVSYAAFPHLALAGCRAPENQPAAYWGLMASIVATHELGVAVPAGLSEGFESSKNGLAEACLQALLRGKWSGREAAFLAVSVIALSRHPLGHLITGSVRSICPEEQCTCVGCGTFFFCVFTEGGVTSYATGTGPEPFVPDDPQARPSPLPSVQVGPSAVAPWDEVFERLESWMRAPGKDASAAIFAHRWRAELEAALEQSRHRLTGAPDRVVACLIGALLVVAGHRDEAIHFFGMAGTVRCPTCALEMTVLECMNHYP